MNLRKLSILLAAVFAFSTVLFGQQDSQDQDAQTFTPKGEIFAGYSFLHSGLQNESLSSGNLNGVTLQATGYILHSNFGITADVTRSGATDIQQSGIDVTRYTYLFGPTYALRTNSAVTPFVHVLFGEDHERFDISNLPNYSTNSFAEAFGAGFDARLTSHIAVRLGQFDYIHTSHTGGESAFRYSAGLVIKF
jgi:opacity protein-like surface antigen